MVRIWIALSLLIGAFFLGRTTAQTGVEELLQADRRFDAAVSEGGSGAWASFFAPDGRMYRRDGQIVSGRDAIRQQMAALLDQEGNSLRWKPAGGEVARSGELGYTTGESVVRYKDADGQLLESRGRYVTIWKRQPDGEWKVALDIGASAPPKPAGR